MNPFAELLGDVLGAVRAAQAGGDLPQDLDTSRIAVEPPRDTTHGDAATNAALVLGKIAKRKPLDVAEMLASRLDTLAKVAHAEVAKPGFVNLRLEDDFWRAQLRTALTAGDRYGAADLGQGRKVNVEYCSVNPNGLLHIGHARGTVFGDALANLLAHMGWEVTREYYINDGGAQIDATARSVWFRYREALGEHFDPFPAQYPGQELIPIGQAIAERDGARWLEAPEEAWLPLFHRETVSAMMTRIRADLAKLGVHHEVFSSELALVREGRVEEAEQLLREHELIYTGTLPPPKGKPVEDYEPVPLSLFRATAFGDDVDRPLKSSKGVWTYFAKDMAYHLDKVRRGAEALIDVWGADHGGYVKRLQAAVAALTGRQASLDVKICQLVNLMDGGQPLKMSKRAGRIVTMADVIDEVGKDVVRFIMLTRKNDAPLEFDLAKVMEQSRDNPVFYVQYAHARICSVQRLALAEGFATDLGSLGDTALEALDDPDELALIRQIAAWPRTLEQAANHHEPHRIVFYLYDLAGTFHALWNRGKERPELRFLIGEEPAITAARLAMLAGVQVVLAAGLRLIGVEPVEEML